MADSFETNIVHTSYVVNDTDNLYGSVRNEAGQIRDVVNSEWDAFPVAGDMNDYDISYGTASGGLWKGDFPDLTACPAGFYIYQIRQGAKAITDPIIASSKGYWNGDVLAKVELDTNGRMKLMPTGLDDIDDTDPGVPTTWPKKMLWLFMRWAHEHVFDLPNGTLKVKKADDSTATTQVFTKVDNVETVEKIT